MDHLLGLESKYYHHTQNLEEVLSSSDIVITDSILDTQAYRAEYQLTQKRIDQLKPDALFNPTPPFYWDEICGPDIRVPQLSHFVGYELKKSLVEVQASLILFSYQK